MLEKDHAVIFLFLVRSTHGLYLALLRGTEKMPGHSHE